MHSGILSSGWITHASPPLVGNRRRSIKSNGVSRRHRAAHVESQIVSLLPQSLNWQYGNIALDNGLAPNRRQAITWSSVVMLYWNIYPSLGLSELSANPVLILAFQFATMAGEISLIKLKSCKIGIDPSYCTILVMTSSYEYSQFYCICHCFMTSIKQRPTIHTSDTITDITTAMNMMTVTTTMMILKYKHSLIYHTYKEISYSFIEIHLSLAKFRFYPIRLSGSKAIINQYLSNYVCSSTTTGLPIFSDSAGNYVSTSRNAIPVTTVFSFAVL